MTDEFLTAIREAIQEIAETMLFVEIVPGTFQAGRSAMAADVSAVIGYSGSLRGSLRLAGPQQSVMKLASALLGEDRSAMDKEMEDAFAELANMIAGGVQSRKESDLGTIRMSPPVVISGRNHQVSSDRSFVSMNHQFEIDGQPFFTEIYYAKDSLGNVHRPVESGRDESHQKYGFALTVPMPGIVRAEDGEMYGGLDCGNDAAPSLPIIDGEALAGAIREAFAKQVEGWSREITQEMVRDMLPGLAERLVKEEIERIKKHGL